VTARRAAVFERFLFGLANKPVLALDLEYFAGFFSICRSELLVVLGVFDVTVVGNFLDILLMPTSTESS
jgi:hypothetical protein